MPPPDLMRSSKPWWREPWPWFLLALPLSAVIGSLVTLWIASSDPDPLVTEDYYKEGMAIYQVLEREARARELGLSASLSAEDGRLWVQLAGQIDTPPGRLNLHVTHPTQAAQDLVLTLYRDASGRYFSDLPSFDIAGKRRLRIEPEDQAWRLNGQWDAPFRGQIRLESGY